MELLTPDVLSTPRTDWKEQVTPEKRVIIGRLNLFLHLAKKSTVQGRLTPEEYACLIYFAQTLSAHDMVSQIRACRGTHGERTLRDLQARMYNSIAYALLGAYISTESHHKQTLLSPWATLDFVRKVRLQGGILPTDLTHGLIRERETQAIVGGAYYVLPERDLLDLDDDRKLTPRLRRMHQHKVLVPPADIHVVLPSTTHSCTVTAYTRHNYDITFHHHPFSVTSSEHAAKLLNIASTYEVS